MITLQSLRNSHRPKKKVQRVGRGVGCKRGKTCGRGNKGDKARRGYERNYGREGGQMPLYKKLPVRGFPNARFRKEFFPIDFDLINQHFNDGELVSYASLREKGLAPRRAVGGIKVLANGEIQKKVSIEAAAFSKAAIEKLDKKSISYKVAKIES